MEPFDFGPTARATADVVAGIRDDQLRGPTPCPAYAVADLVDHVVGLTREFTLAGRKEPNPVPQATGDATRLPDGWREDLPGALVDLAAAWADPAAWAGTTHAGPFDFPAPEAAAVALNEVVVHGWDLARATSQAYVPDPAAIERCLAFVTAFDAPADDGGLFGPPVQVDDDASAMDRLAAATGRDPGWAPPA